jgi:hypothetical protein
MVSAVRRAIDITPAIRGLCLSRGIDAAIAALAECQNGIVIRAQLLALGLSSNAIDRRIAAGRLHVLHPGVYAVGDRALPPLGRLAAVRGIRATTVSRTLLELEMARNGSPEEGDLTVRGLRHPNPLGFGGSVLGPGPW